MEKVQKVSVTFGLKSPQQPVFSLTKPIKHGIMLHIMSKVSPSIAGYVFLSIYVALVLGACMKPVDVGVGRDKRSEIKVGVDFETIEDILPVLQASIGGKTSSVSADEIISVSLDSLGSDAITVINMEDYDTVEWHYNRGPVEGGATFVLGSMTVIFNTAGVYPVTAVGRKAGVSYSTLFYINVGS